ncbi:MAG: hypothetical protein JSR99_16975 [Proteobacteria bacterium]|nr:hypothetical protein [Pseudomonadota bacterium]
MRRLSRISIINQIERIAKDPVLGLGRHHWETNGVRCSLDRHTYSGDLYSFSVEILRVAPLSARSKKWELYLVTEFWREPSGETVRMSKWLKLIAGKAADVTKWLAENGNVIRPAGKDSPSN